MAEDDDRPRFVQELNTGGQLDHQKLKRIDKNPFIVNDAKLPSLRVTRSYLNTIETKCKSTYDVVIIGAGLAGLSAALYLKDCNINNILILEARDVVGGRISTDHITIDGQQCYVDTGGAYVGYGQNRILKMAQRYNIKTHKVYTTPNFVTNVSGKTDILKEDGMNMSSVQSIFNSLDLNYIFQQLNALASALDLKDNKSLKKYDTITCKAWVKSLIPNNQSAQYIFDAFIELLYCVQSEQISLFEMLHEVKLAGSIEAIVDDMSTHKFVGGAHSIAVKMRNEINGNNKSLDEGKIRYDHVVECIEYDKDQDDGVCIVYCANGKQFDAKYVMCCIPPSLYQNIRFVPSLSWQRRDTVRGFHMGYIIKTNVFYKTAFWREKGLSRSVSCGLDENDEFPIAGTDDDVKPDGTFPAITGFITADKAIKYATKYHKEQRKKIILKQYRRLFDDERAVNECVGYIEKIWHYEEFSGGGWGAPLINTHSKPYFHKIRDAEGKRLYLASSELATQWIGYMDGAVQSGQREANKIAMLLKQERAENDSDIGDIVVVNYSEKEDTPQPCDIEYVDR
eukprot:124772_1